MKKFGLIGLLSISLSACNGGVNKLPCPPEKPPVIIEREVPVPVLCKVEIKKAEIAIDKAEKGLELEGQNALLRSSIAEQKAYIVLLEAGIIGCGGSVK